MTHPTLRLPGAPAPVKPPAYIEARVSLGMSTAYVRLGELPQARELLMTQWDKLNHGGEFALSLRELLALAQPGGHPALAGSRPTEAGIHGS